MYADFSAAAVAPQVDVGDACASFQEQFEFLEPAKFIRFAGDDYSKLKLASLPTCLRMPRPEQTFAMFMMVVVMMMIMAVIAMAPMVVIVIAVFAVRLTFLVMSFVVMSFAVAMIVTAFGAMLMSRFVIAVAFRPMNMLFCVK
jgi:hypothetical protein